MKTLILYSTVGCHLCEKALDMVAPLVNDQYEINIIDIVESNELIERYGVRIPVFARDNGLEIGWPFDASEFLNFLSQ